jgi:mycothiol synthase
VSPSAAVPDGYEFRPAGHADLSGIEALLDAFDVADMGEPGFNSVVLEADWRRPRFQPSRDAFVALASDGTVAAYGEAFDEDRPHEEIDMFGRVHPQHRGRGLGAALLGRLEARAREHLTLAPAGWLMIHGNVVGTDAAAHRLLEAGGYAPVRHFWHMETSLEDSGPPIDPPGGIEVRGFVPGEDDRRAFDLLQEAFREHWGFNPDASFEEWLAFAKDVDELDPSLWWFAVDGGVEVGLVTARRMGDRGWVGDLGVLPGHRGRGIGGFLLRLAFEQLRRQGFRRIGLNVDAENATGATGLYERAGMRVRRQWDVYEKIVGETP